MDPRAQFPDEQSADGSFERQDDAFRDFVSTDGSTHYPAVPGRYHLYVSLACPWACRTVIVRMLKGLEASIGLTVLDPIRDDRGWAFRDGPGFSRDPLNGFSFLSEAYEASDPGYRGRFTVPVLWDKVLRRIVSNSEDEICRMLNSSFCRLGDGTPDLFPPEIEAEHETLSKFIYGNVNNGVYEAGFATDQAAYERAFWRVFTALDALEARLARSRFLFGDRIVEADWRLFCTLVRFDPVYHGHFKCNLRPIAAYSNLQGYLLDLYQQPGIAATVNFDHIKRHYYCTHGEINPTRIFPVGPAIDMERDPGRARQYPPA